MKIEKSYALGENEAKQVAQVIAEGKKTFEKIAHIVCESQIDASVFFDHELSEDRTGQ